MVRSLSEQNCTPASEMARSSSEQNDTRNRVKWHKVCPRMNNVKGLRKRTKPTRNFNGIWNQEYRYIVQIIQSTFFKIIKWRQLKMVKQNSMYQVSACVLLAKVPFSFMVLLLRWLLKLPSNTRTVGDNSVCFKKLSDCLWLEVWLIKSFTSFSIFSFSTINDRHAKVPVPNWELTQSK